MNTPNRKDNFDVNDISTNKVIAMISYLLFGLLFFVPLAAANDSKFAKFHANQALLFFIAFIVISVVSIIIGIIPFIGAIIVTIIRLLLVVAMILLMVDAYNGNARELPIIGNIEIIK